jgi:hypothetical protein
MRRCPNKGHLPFTSHRRSSPVLLRRCYPSRSTLSCCFFPAVPMMQSAQTRQRDYGCSRRWLLVDRSLIGCVFAEAIVNSIFVMQLSNRTPILGISVKSAIPGTHGTAGQCGCMPLWKSAAKSCRIAAWKKARHLGFWRCPSGCWTQRSAVRRGWPSQDSPARSLSAN